MRARIVMFIGLAMLSVGMVMETDPAGGQDHEGQGTACWIDVFTDWGVDDASFELPATMSSADAVRARAVEVVLEIQRGFAAMDGFDDDGRITLAQQAALAHVRPHTETPSRAEFVWAEGEELRASVLVERIGGEGEWVVTEEHFAVASDLCL